MLAVVHGVSASQASLARSLAEPTDVEGGPARQPGHGHLWRLADGTGLHAPFGQLTRHPESGEVCCHLCGRWFRALGSHIRVHGYTGAAYREAMGLTRTRPLTSPDHSAAISAHATRRYRSSPLLRSYFAPGQERARLGTLNRAPAAARRPQASRLQLEATEAGRCTVERRRDRARRELLAAAGAEDLASYLRTAYGAGASLDELARRTQLGRARLREAVVAAGATLRPTGRNTAAGKRSRAMRSDAAAAARVGVDDVGVWLARQRSEGATLAELAQAAGFSTGWVRARLGAGVRHEPVAEEVDSGPAGSQQRNALPVSGAAVDVDLGARRS